MNHLCKGVANWRSELYLSALCVQIEQQKNRLFTISQHVFTACLSSTTYIYYGYNKIKFCMFQSQGERFAEKHLQFQTFALLNIHKLTKTYEAKHVFIFNWNGWTASIRKIKINGNSYHISSSRIRYPYIPDLSVRNRGMQIKVSPFLFFDAHANRRQKIVFHLECDMVQLLLANSVTINDWQEFLKKKM